MREEIVRMKFGSHLYGTQTPESDTDFKAVYLPTKREILLGSYQQTIQIKRQKEEKERNTKDDIDIEIFSLDRFLDLLCQGQTVALDMIFATPDVLDQGGVVTSEIWHQLVRGRGHFLSKNVNAFVGYARQQAAKYGIKGSRMDALKRAMAVLSLIPNASRLEDYTDELKALVKECEDLISLEKLPLIEIIDLPQPGGLIVPHLHICGRKIGFKCTGKFASDVVGKILEGYGSRAQKAHLAGGVDWKALSHAVRVNYEALELLKTGHITFPRPEKDLLIQIKTGQLEYPQVAEMIEQGLADLYAAHEVSELQAEPSRELANDFIAATYEMVVKR